MNNLNETDVIVVDLSGLATISPLWLGDKKPTDNWNENHTGVGRQGVVGNGVILSKFRKGFKADDVEEEVGGCVSKSYYGSNGTVNKGDNKPFIMFALNSGSKQERRLIELYLQRNVKEVVGCYKRVQEPAYILVLSGNFLEDKPVIERLLRLTDHYHQESILLVDSKRKASLMYLESEDTEDIGYFVRSNPAEAIALGNWTLDGSTFWVCKYSFK